ncbi:MAG TPA: Gfo/Idh/MocA family oxidoreductase [Streptosporangiaceae bacterium]|jgi:predicted dehydrogenase
MTDLDAQQASELGWGILGTGHIADLFAADLPAAGQGRVRAVASRDADRAATFAAQHDVRTAHRSYDALLADPDVDCVYLALPNHLHLEWTERAARAGKHVLCEKPLAMNAREAAQAIATARRHGVVLLEAFMYRMHPQIMELNRLLEAGTIGEVRLLEASFGGNLNGQYDNYRMQRQTGGGALMDVGCYGVSMARLVAGAQVGRPFAEPVSVQAAARIGPRSQVDEWSAAVLNFDGPLVATISCGNQVDLASCVRIWGSEGHAELTNPWQPATFRGPGRLLVHANGSQVPEVRVIDTDRPLYALEADTFAQVVRTGQIPAPVMSPEDSLGNMRVLDSWRRAIGLTFDQDREDGA